MGDTCLACLMTYINGKVCTLPTDTIYKCYRYENDKLCSYCDMGYMLSNDKRSCVSIGIDNCAFIDQKNYDGKCMMCMNGKRNDPLTGKCTEDDCTAPNCKMCHVNSAGGKITNEVCGWCNDGYSHNYGICITAPIANCMYAPDGKCASC